MLFLSFSYCFLFVLYSLTLFFSSNNSISLCWDFDPIFVDVIFFVIHFFQCFRSSVLFSVSISILETNCSHFFFGSKKKKKHTKINWWLIFTNFLPFPTKKHKPFTQNKSKDPKRRSSRKFTKRKWCSKFSQRLRLNRIFFDEIKQKNSTIKNK